MKYKTAALRTWSSEYPTIPKVVEERAEPGTPQGCCDDLQPGEFCQPQCVRMIQNDETALAVDVGYYLDFQATFCSPLSDMR